MPYMVTKSPSWWFTSTLARELWYSRSLPGIIGVLVLVSAWGMLADHIVRYVFLIVVGDNGPLISQADWEWGDVPSVSIKLLGSCVIAVRLATPYSMWREKTLMVVLLLNSLVLLDSLYGVQVQPNLVLTMAFITALGLTLFLFRNSRAAARLKFCFLMVLGFLLLLPVWVMATARRFVSQGVTRLKRWGR